MTKRFIWMIAGIIVLLGVFQCGVHFGRMSFTSSCGSQVWVSWDHGGQFPVEAYDTINLEANEHLSSLLQGRVPGAECFVIPHFGGYKLILWAGHPLRALPRDVESNTVEFIHRRLWELAAEVRTNDLTD